MLSMLTWRSKYHSRSGGTVLSFPIPSLFLPFPPLSCHFPRPFLPLPLRSRPTITAGSIVSSTSGIAEIEYFVHFFLKVWHLVAPILLLSFLKVIDHKCTGEQYRLKNKEGNAVPVIPSHYDHCSVTSSTREHSQGSCHQQGPPV